MAGMPCRDTPPEGAYPIVVSPDVYEQVRAIAQEQAISVDMAAQILLVDALRRAGRWRAGTGDRRAEMQRHLLAADEGQPAGE